MAFEQATVAVDHDDASAGNAKGGASKTRRGVTSVPGIYSLLCSLNCSSSFGAYCFKRFCGKDHHDNAPEITLKLTNEH